MNNDQPSQKTLDEVLLLVDKLGPEALASQFQEVALELARQEQSLQKRITCLEQQHQQWNSERQQSEADIHEQSAELAEAWLRLENERRYLSTAAKTSTDRSPPSHTQPEESHGARFQAVRTTSTDVPESNNRGSHGPSLVEQFQLLSAAGKTNGSHRS